jgi:SAM-dependent methyltransferase
MHVFERRLRYGLDAPAALVISVVAGVVLVVVGLTVAPWVLAIGFASLIYAALHLWGSAAGKVRRAKRLLDQLPWRGDEVVLDVGCGHGLLLIEAARRLTTGHAVGVDVWSQKDQWHNSRDATNDNARWAGVEDRVDVRDADARELPFDDATFDAVVSSLVIHNIPGRAERERAVREMARVLKPGGHVAIVDLARTSEYAQSLTDAGLVEVHRSRAGVLFLPTARVVTARRPQAL